MPYSGADSWSTPWGDPKEIEKSPLRTRAPWEPKSVDEDRLQSPDPSRPSAADLLKRMRKVNPAESKKDRHRTGE